MSALDRLEELEQVATSGPWRWDGGTLVDDGHDEAIGISRASAVQTDDAELIAALRNAAPALLRVARAAERWHRAEIVPGTIDAAIRELDEAVQALKERDIS
jgi:hypothetical protein